MRRFHPWNNKEGMAGRREGTRDKLTEGVFSYQCKSETSKRGESISVGRNYPPATRIQIVNHDKDVFIPIKNHCAIQVLETEIQYPQSELLFQQMLVPCPVALVPRWEQGPFGKGLYNHVKFGLRHGQSVEARAHAKFNVQTRNRTARHEPTRPETEPEGVVKGDGDSPTLIPVNDYLRSVKKCSSSRGSACLKHRCNRHDSWSIQSNTYPCKWRKQGPGSKGFMLGTH
ncbi:uncharacterized protein EI90DRAFT_3031339 [Cantharellus anzutake]|uniref:uncharacterized protein n=1 Tax=Cantharellus anzutake TaxID=1750568 RepID=UPI0019053EA4|nr:uncharacterized protein EI90DRAFT_3031339 [Cantharellus anzutake]KAF8343094.1 hypothetical protein EI90DRAFT_3031339 [Cantharellus anzutake]